MIKLTHNSDLISEGTQRIIIVGRSGSGKTYSLLKLLPMLADGTIFIISPTMDQPVYNALIKSKEYDIITMKNIPPLESIIKTTKQLKKDDSDIDESDSDIEESEEKETLTHKIVIIDDFDIQTLKKKAVEYFTRGRHYGITVILIYQRYFNIPRIIRENASIVMLFDSNDGYKYVYNAFQNLFKGDKKIFDEIVDIIYEEPYNFMMLSFENNKKRRVRFGFDKFLIQ